MRPAPAVLLAALFAATLVPSGQQPAVASCASPYLTDVGRLVLHRGSSVDIEGAAFVDGCQDTGECSSTPGCSSCDDGPEPTPMTDIRLSLRQGGRTWSLGTADASTAQGDVGTVAWEIEVPIDIARGWATLVPEHGEPARVRVG